MMAKTFKDYHYESELLDSDEPEIVSEVVEDSIDKEVNKMMVYVNPFDFDSLDPIE